jgi:hypothetical protein
MPWRAMFKMPWRAMFNLKSTKAVVLTPQRPKGAITPYLQNILKFNKYTFYKK